MKNELVFDEKLAQERLENKDLTEFTKELETLLNRCSIDAYCGVHDFVLSEMITNFVIGVRRMNREEARLRS